LIKVYIKELFRIMGLILLYDKIIFIIMKLKYYNLNKLFLKLHPEITLPSDYIIFESFQLNYHEFYYGGLDTAKFIVELISNYIKIDDISILEWGCGPGRIIRHLPRLTNSNCNYFATDYNSKSVNWCKENIQNINFDINDLEPPLKYSNNFFDFIYGISVLTHLSEKNYYNWYEELIRIIKPNGLILLTTHGEASTEKLKFNDKQTFNNNSIIEKGNTAEGHRTFTSYAPESFIKNLFSTSSEIIFYKKGEPQDWGIEKDIWIIKKLTNPL